MAKRYNPDKPSTFDDETLAEILIAAMGETELEQVTSADLFGSSENPHETLVWNNFKVLDRQDSRDGLPASVTYVYIYSRPINKPYVNLHAGADDRGFFEKAYVSDSTLNDLSPLYYQNIRVYLSSNKDRLEEMPAQVEPPSYPNMPPYHDSDGSDTMTLAKGDNSNTVIPVDNDIALHGNSVYMRPYILQRPHKLRGIDTITALQTGKSYFSQFQFNDIRFHSNLAEILREEAGIENSRDLASSLENITNSSGRSGVDTYRANLLNVKGQVAFKCVLTITEGDWHRKVAEHATTCQQILKDRGLPVAKIYRPVTPYYYHATGQCYYLQEHARGKHFDVDTRHLRKLGASLAEIHAIPVNEMPEQPARSVAQQEEVFSEAVKGLDALSLPPREKSILEPEALLEEARDGLEAALHEDAEKPFATQEEMVLSIKGQLLGSFSWQELQANPERRELCQRLRLTRSDAIAFEREQKKQEKLDRILPRGTCWGDVHLKNLLTTEDGDITLLDFQTCGEGVLATELALATYFLLANKRGTLDQERMKAFFEPYCEGRAQHNEPGPLTQEEVMAIIQKVHSLSQRQAHPIWVMLRSQATGFYREFSQRHSGLQTQLENYMEDGVVTREGAGRFAQELLGVSLDTLPLSKEQKNSTSHKKNWVRDIAPNGHSGPTSASIH